MKAFPEGVRNKSRSCLQKIFLKSSSSTASHRFEKYKSDRNQGVLSGMNYEHLQQPSVMSTSKQFFCFRSDDREDNYMCAIDLFGLDTIRIELDIIFFCVNREVANEIGECLRDAISFSRGVARDHAKRLLIRRYRDGFRGRRYTAEGSIEVTDASIEFSDAGASCPYSGEARIAINTVSGGGYELVFDFMCYSFTERDAVWLSNSLLQAALRFSPSDE